MSNKLPLYDILIEKIDKKEFVEININKWTIILTQISNLPNANEHYRNILLLIIHHYVLNEEVDKIKTIPYNPKVIKSKGVTHCNLSFPVDHLPTQLIRIIAAYFQYIKDEVSDMA